MSGTRRSTTDNSETRKALLDVTERLMREEGYAAVSSRRVGREAGVTPALVHYYFATLDDLFLAVFRQGAEKNLSRHARVLESPQPLHALWEFSIEPSGTVLLTEFMALANHRKSIRSEIAEYAMRFRRLQLALLESRRWGQPEPTGQEVPLPALLVVLGCLSRGLVMEDELGITEGHAETRALVEQLLSRFDDNRGDRAPEA
ncbi:TetR/AcrR family transcriptional regulator [Streptomyces sp. NPDC050263]|uniref:TetR/AcrR family transcriptional regulator n=1 Tax=Streptomyces sp. NPDC050263 TaxID=3155037 RepID=UPI003448D154